jgi:predicted O-linked N-acetylglucosamine transferase (SPINDLY family)
LRADRIHFIPRVGTSDDFLRLIGSADVILHPFPFGGSKTSADAVTMGVPMVTMRTAFLRGRMAQVYYRTMGMVGPEAAAGGYGTIEYLIKCAPFFSSYVKGS